MDTVRHSYLDFGYIDKELVSGSRTALYLVTQSHRPASKSGRIITGHLFALHLAALL